MDITSKYSCSHICLPIIIHVRFDERGDGAAVGAGKRECGALPPDWLPIGFWPVALELHCQRLGMVRTGVAELFIQDTAPFARVLFQTCLTHGAAGSPMGETCMRGQGVGNTAKGAPLPVMLYAAARVPCTRSLMPCRQAAHSPTDVSPAPLVSAVPSAVNGADDHA